MSWSLQVRHGDLVTIGAQLGTVTNQPKLVQDLRLWLLERMGTDPLHPEFGSLIDGGTLPNGSEVSSVIGTNDPDVAEVLIQREIHRICQEYQRQQLARAKFDKHTYGKATLSPAEVLIDLVDVQFEQDQDRINVVAVLRNANGDLTRISNTLSTEVATELLSLVR